MIRPVLLSLAFVAALGIPAWAFAQAVGGSLGGRSGPRAGASRQPAPAPSRGSRPMIGGGPRGGGPGGRGSQPHRPPMQNFDGSSNSGSPDPYGPYITNGRGAPGGGGRGGPPGRGGPGAGNGGGCGGMAGGRGR